MIVVISVPQAVLDHGVYGLLVAHAGAPALVGEGKGSGGHVLGAAGHNDVGVTGLDGTGGLDDGLHAGAADHADGVGGDGEGNAGLHADLASHILAQAGGQHTAKHDLIHVLGGDIGALQGLLDHDRAQIGCGDILQRATKITNSSTAAVYNVHFAHDITSINYEFCII